MELLAPAEHFSFCSSLETSSGQLLDKLPRVWLITCGSCLEICRVWCKATAAKNHAWTVQCPQQHLELIATPNHQAFSCDSAGTGGQRRDYVVICFLWLDLWMNRECMASDLKPWLHFLCCLEHLKYLHKHAVETPFLNVPQSLVINSTLNMKIFIWSLIPYYVSAVTHSPRQRTGCSFIHRLLGHSSFIDYLIFQSSKNNTHMAAMRCPTSPLSAV